MAAPRPRVPIRVDLRTFKTLSESERSHLLALLREVNEHLGDDSLDFLCGYLEAEHKGSCE